MTSPSVDAELARVVVRGGESKNLALTHHSEPCRLWTPPTQPGQGREPVGGLAHFRPLQTKAGRRASRNVHVMAADGVGGRWRGSMHPCFKQVSMIKTYRFTPKKRQGHIFQWPHRISPIRSSV